MKNLKIIISGVILLAMASTSCSDFLDKQPTTRMSAATFWKSTDDVDRAILGVYSAFRTTRFSTTSTTATATNLMLEMEGLSDNAITGSFYQSFAQGSFDASTSGIGDIWSDAYKGIAKANYFLENVDRAADLYSAADLNALKGEARFIRAYFYNAIVQVYGNAPITLQTEYVGSGYDALPRTRKADIVKDVILPDLDFAIQYLPNTSYTGYAVKGSAVLLKVRVLLNNLRYAEAASLAAAYIQGSGDYGACPFSLYSNYSGLFYNEQLNSANKEIMFSVMFATDDHHTLDQMIGSRMTVGPTQSLRDSYESGDKRLKQTIFEWDDPWINNDRTQTFNQTGNRAEGTIPATAMAFKKYVDTTIYVPVASTTSSQHIVLMRYADLLLMYAEAKMEVDGGSTSDPLALQCINEVRSRSGLGELTAPITREQVRKERRIELAFEGLRYNDLIRWGIAEEAITSTPYNFVSSNTYPKEVNTYRNFGGYIWPIPQAQLDIMTEWQQNPLTSAATYDYYKSISYLP